MTFGYIIGYTLVKLMNARFALERTKHGKRRTYAGYGQRRRAITLTDDEGNEVEFEFLDVVEFEGEEYIVLIENDEDADEVVILKINAIDEDTEEYVSIDDDELLQSIFEIFKQKYEGEINFE